MPDTDRVESAQELASLFPQPRALTVGGRQIEIHRVGIAQAGRIISAAMPVYNATGGDVDLLELFDSKPDEINAIIVAGTGAEATWVASLEPVDKFAIVTAWMEVNAAFFVQRLLPLMASFMKSMALIGGGGPTSSTSSSSTAT